MSAPEHAPPDVMTRATARLKLAVRRDPGYPIGQPAPCHLLCCDERVPIGDGSRLVACPSCGNLYRPDGWLVMGGAR